MNLVIDDAVEVKQPTKTEPDEKRRELGITFWLIRHYVRMLTNATGQILLKGDNVSLIQALQ